MGFAGQVAGPGLGTGLVVGDRGCLPTFAAAAAPYNTAGPSSLTQPLVLGIGTGATQALATLHIDYYGIVTVLCGTHGVCCTTFNCNSSTKHISSSNLIILLLSAILTKFF